MWPVRHYNIFQRDDFRKNVIEYKNMCLDFLWKFVWKIYHSKNNWARYDKNVYWLSRKVPVIFVQF
jgi:hypothetical protein